MQIRSETVTKRMRKRCAYCGAKPECQRFSVWMPPRGNEVYCSIDHLHRAIDKVIAEAI